MPTIGRPIPPTLDIIPGFPILMNWTKTNYFAHFAQPNVRRRINSVRRRRATNGDFGISHFESRQRVADLKKPCLEAGSELVCGRPGWIVVVWLLLVAVVGSLSPSLTRLSAEGQAKTLAADAESQQAARILRQSWPDQSYDSMVVAALHRTSGLTEADRKFAGRLAQRFEATDRPKEIARVLGPNSDAEIAHRLVSSDASIMLVAIPLSSPFVAPAAHETVDWLEAHAKDPDLAAPGGLEIRWTGDAVIGREYMANVKTSLDRAALATVVLLMIVLVLVYRSFWLALVPLATIGASLIVARGLLAWSMLAGWEVSPLVELFLVAILFGTGTDFCLFLSWRYAEHLDPADPIGSMRSTLARSRSALITSAGTIIVGLMLMGTTRFKLFSSTGPSVALGLALARTCDRHVDARAVGASCASPAAGLFRPRRKFAFILGAPRAQCDDAAAPKLAADDRGHASALAPRSSYPLHPGPAERASGRHRRRDRFPVWSRPSSSRACSLP